MNIEQLPVEMLIKIFKLLPTYNEVSLVSKQFYSIACQVSHWTNCLRINQRFFNNGVMDSEFMQSLRTSNRSVSKLELAVGELGEFLSIINNFSSTIKYFKCTNIEIDGRTLAQVLSSMSNIKHLHLDRVKFWGSMTQDHSAHRLTNSDLNLTKLTSLTIDIFACIPENLVEFFSRLPAGIIIDLRITNLFCDALNSLLTRQWNIKNLKLEYNAVTDVTTDIFNKLQLESLSLRYVIEHPDLASILANQTRLKSLTLSGRIDYEIANAVADCLTLEKLVINAAYVSLESFRTLGKLKKLKDLTLMFPFDDGHNAMRLRFFAEWDNVTLQKLCIKQYDEISARVVSILAKSAPNLKHVKFHSSQNIQFGYFTEAKAIMESFNFVEIFEIETWEEPNWENNYFNPNLRELKISVDGMYYEQWLWKCFVAYPNLQKLQMQISPKINEPIAALKLRLILNGFTKLVSLNLTASNLIVEDLDYLHNHKENLKFVSLGFLERGALTDDLIKRLRENFAMIHVDQHGRFMAAIDRYTMDCESYVEQCDV